jgi:CheY-like chemotaxis protein
MMKRVLLIEDDTWLGESFTRVLSGEFSVVFVDTMTAAIDAINAELPDVIVADFMLSGKNSIELMHELSSYEDTAGIPIILCSTIGEEIKPYGEQLRHYGVVNIVDKSELTPDILVRTVREVLATHEAAA